MGLWKAIKKAWMTFADVFGRIQTTILLTVVYHLTVGPLSVMGRLAGQEFMQLKPPKRDGGPGSYMVDLKPITSTLERAKEQF